MTSYPSIYFVWRENSNSIVLILEHFANPIHTSCLMSYERHGQFESPTTFENLVVYTIFENHFLNQFGKVKCFNVLVRLSAQLYTHTQPGGQICPPAPGITRVKEVGFKAKTCKLCCIVELMQTTVHSLPSCTFEQKEVHKVQGT